MLFFFTSLTDFLGMAVSLWLATYLLARGFPGRVTLRAGVVLLTLAASFFISYINLYETIPGVAALWAVLLTIGLAAWYDLTYQLLPPPAQSQTRWIAWSIYALGLAKIALLVGLRQSLTDTSGNSLWILPMWTLPQGAAPLAIADVLYLVLTTAAILYNFRLGAQSEGGLHSRATWAAFILAASAVGYGILAIVVTPGLPSLVQNGLLLAAVAVLGYAVATRQVLVERRTTLQDFPVAGLAIFGLSGLYTFAAWQGGFSAEEIAFITALAILTHSAYDLVREFLDRLLHRHESALRQKLRALAREVGGESTLPNSLHGGLNEMCRAVNAAGGFIAIRQEQSFVVAASLNSLGVGSPLDAVEVACEDVCQPTTALAQKVAWLAPAFVGADQVAVIGLGPRATRGKYSDADLDLLSDVADWASRMVSTHTQQQDSRERLTRLTTEMQRREIDLRTGPEDLTTAFDRNPDTAFIRWVEEELRNLSDYTTLGQSPLAAQLEVQGGTHIERGKAVRQRLTQAIETLRPAPRRPPEPLPREWYSYAILYDAYIEDVPNREIMARLYISEGTFNRMRRKALRAVARNLLEMKSGASAIRATASQAALAA